MLPSKIRLFLIYLFCSVRLRLLKSAPDSLISFIIGPKYQRPRAIDHAQPSPHEHDEQTIPMQFVFDCDTSEQRCAVAGLLRSFLQGDFVTSWQSFILFDVIQAAFSLRGSVIHNGFQCCRLILASQRSTSFFATAGAASIYVCISSTAERLWAPQIAHGRVCLSSVQRLWMCSVQRSKSGRFGGRDPISRLFFHLSKNAFCRQWHCCRANTCHGSKICPSTLKNA
jgi:hypothetical protein